MATNLAIEQTVEESLACRPFLKWAGGKTRLLPELISRVPSEFANYHEPFLGGGALFFALQPKSAFLTDINAELINAYTVVRDQTEELVAELGKLKPGKRKFYSIRNADRRGDFWTWSPAERAARLIYLNKTCFNGLYRVNSSGQFNVPFGDYQNPRILDAENLRNCAEALKSAKLKQESFVAVVERAAKGDFVYFDPPYVPLSETASFTSYSQDGFSDGMHVELRDVCRELDKKGVRFLLSNSSTKLTTELFAEWKVEEVLSSRSINSKGDRRGKVQELVVRNY